MSSWGCQQHCGSAYQLWHPHTQYLDSTDVPQGRSRHQVRATQLSDQTGPWCWRRPRAHPECSCSTVTGHLDMAAGDLSARSDQRGGRTDAALIPPGSSKHIGRVTGHPCPVSSGLCPRMSPSSSWPAEFQPEPRPPDKGSTLSRIQHGAQQTADPHTRARGLSALGRPTRWSSCPPTRLDHHQDHLAHPTGAAWPVTKGAPATM